MEMEPSEVPARRCRALTLWVPLRVLPACLWVLSGVVAQLLQRPSDIR